MKFLLHSILLMSCCMLHAQADDVAVQLRSCRTEYRTHNASTDPGLSCTLELIPPKGKHLCESMELAGIIRVKDASGMSRLAERRAIVITPQNRALSTFTLPQRPTGSAIEVQGELVVTVAEERTAHEPIAVNLQQKAELTLGADKIRIEPAARNSARANREGDKIRCAELKITSLGSNTIRRIERVWKADNGEQYTQPIEQDDMGNKMFKILLWDAHPTEQLRFVTVKNPRREQVKFRFQVELGNVTIRKP